MISSGAAKNTGGQMRLQQTSQSGASITLTRPYILSRALRLIYEVKYCPPKLSGRTDAGETHFRAVVPSDRKNQLTGAECFKTGRISLPERSASEPLHLRSGRTGIPEGPWYLKAGRTLVPKSRKNRCRGISLPELRAAEMLQERAGEESSLPRRCQRACRSLLH